MNTTKRIRPQTFHVQTFARCARITAILLIAFCSGRAEELPRPGEAIDAGDAYVLKDGSRVAVYRLVNEVAIKHLRTESVEPIVRQVEIEGEPLATIENGRSHIVEIASSMRFKNAEMHTIWSKDLKDFNSEETQRIGIESSKPIKVDGKFNITIPKHSINVLKWEY